MRHFPKDRTHADRLFAGVMGGWNGGIVEKEEQMVLDLGIASLQPSAVGVGGLECQTAVDTPLQITPILIQGGGREGITTLVNGKGPQEHGLYPWRKHGISRVEGKLTIPDLVGQTDLPVRSGVILLRTREIGHPDRRPMRTQDFLDHALSPAGADDRDTNHAVLKHPLPLLLAIHAGAGFIAANQAAAAQPGEDLRHALVQPAFDPLEEVGQAPFTDVQTKHLREERRQTLVTDRVRVAQVRCQTLDRGAKRGARFHPGRDRSHIRLAAALTPTAIAPRV